MENMKIRKFQESEDYEVSVNESEKSEVSKGSSTVWRTDMTQFQLQRDPGYPNETCLFFDMLTF